LARNWTTKIETLLSHSQFFKLRYSNPDTQIFQYVPQPCIIQGATPYTPQTYTPGSG
jgi:hypothetical protein